MGTGIHSGYPCQDALEWEKSLGFGGRELGLKPSPTTQHLGELQFPHTSSGVVAPSPTGRGEAGETLQHTQRLFMSARSGHVSASTVLLVFLEMAVCVKLRNSQEVLGAV